MENYKKFYNVHMKSKLDFLLALVFLIVLLKPIVSQITPIWLKRKFRKNMDNRNRKGD